MQKERHVPHFPVISQLTRELSPAFPHIWENIIKVNTDYSAKFLKRITLLGLQQPLPPRFWYWGLYHETIGERGENMKRNREKVTGAFCVCGLTIVGPHVCSFLIPLPVGYPGSSHCGGCLLSRRRMTQVQFAFTVLLHPWKKKITHPCFAKGWEGRLPPWDPFSTCNSRPCGYHHHPCLSICISLTEIHLIHWQGRWEW